MFLFLSLALDGAATDSLNQSLLHEDTCDDHRDDGEDERHTCTMAKLARRLGSRAGTG
jgi:hypothetical protein